MYVCIYVYIYIYIYIYIVFSGWTVAGLGRASPQRFFHVHDNKENACSSNNNKVVMQVK